MAFLFLTPQESEEDEKLPALNLLICLVARYKPQSIYLYILCQISTWCSDYTHVFSCPAGILSRMTWQTGRSEDGVELN